jgi:Tn7-like transposition protein D/TniQ
MVGFFPTPYPDELLYSVLARYYLWSPNISPKVALKELFGKTTVVATFDLPSHIENLLENLTPGSKHTSKSFTQQNTLFPFYAPFLPRERGKIVYGSMRKHYSGDIHTRTGITASSVPQIKFFRFCQNCLQEDIESYGEPYWHRVHQIAGVLICPTHQTLLQNSSIKIQNENRHEFYAADVDNCIFKPYLVEYDKVTMTGLLDIAKDTEEILNSALPSKSGKWFRRKYTSLLIEKGLATASGRIHQKEFINEFINYYGRSFLQLVHSDIDIDNENNWLSSIVRKHRKVFHPLRHLLLIRFLEQSISEFFENENKEQNPFGEGSWTCFNGAANHYLQKTIKSVSVSYSHDIKKLVGTFSCDCGFVYSTSDTDVPHSQKLSYGKIKSFGKMWERKLKKLLIDKKVSLREASRQLKVDTKTVILHAKKLGFIPENKATENTSNIDSLQLFRFKRKEYRSLWIKEKRKHQSFSKTELRKINSKIYIWLYRNDSKWLESNSPPKKQIVSDKQIVDWANRDDLIYSQSQLIIQQLSNQLPLVRITNGIIANKLGLRSLLQKYLDKLPKTKALLEKSTESVEQFQLRRIRWAISKLFAEKNMIRNWEVVRLAGLGKITAQKFDKIITAEIEFFYRQNLQKKVG